jgi:SAM-dependent methyltransferase
VPAEQVSAASSPVWSWDPTLYAGAARYYTTGRVAYPSGVADALVSALGLDGTGRLLDVGCGPGSLTLLLAPHFAEAIGVDADADMLAEASRLAEQRQMNNLRWVQMRAEELPADFPAMRVVSFAQSFHWMDRRSVALAARRLVADGGALVHVGATTHQGVDTDVALPHPRPPRQKIARLVRSYLGPTHRAGQGVLTVGTPEDEDTIYRAAGFAGPERLEVPGWVVERSAAEIVASVHSLSGSTPHLFADRLSAFDAELSELLAAASPDGRFSEQIDSIGLYIWR